MRGKSESQPRGLQGLNSDKNSRYRMNPALINRDLNLSGIESRASNDGGAQKGKLGGQQEYQPSLNRMLVDIKKLDYFKDPNSVLSNLRTTLEEVSQKNLKDQQ